MRGIPLITPEWSAPEQVAACVTTRLGGVSRKPYDNLNLGTHVGDDLTSVEENRRRLAAQLDIEEPVWLEQVHGTAVHSVGTDFTQPPCADASVSREPGGVCVVMTADCLPVLFTDRAGTVVAAAHAGWRGLHGGVLEATVEAMQVPAEDILVWMGPAIGPDAFEVGPEVRDAFAQKLGNVEAAFQSGDGDRWMADIYGLARMTLASVGVHNVSGGGFCTYRESERFFSYRREPSTGRMASLIWLRS